MAKQTITAPTMLATFFTFLVIAANVHAASSYQLSIGTNQDITEHSVCKTVTNNHASNQSIFIPTNSASEWTAFYTSPAVGVSTVACITGCSTSGLMGHWLFNETSGASTAIDASGNGNNGTLTNANTATAWVAGKVGNALTLDGVNDYMGMAASGLGGLGPSSATLAFWVRAGALPGKVANHRKSGWNGWGIETDATATWFYYTGNNASSDTGCVLGASLPIGTWAHLTVVVDRTAGFYRCYRNGALNNSGAITHPALNNANPIYFGSRGEVPDGFFRGTFDDARIYNRALTGPEVTALYNSGTGCADPDTTPDAFNFTDQANASTSTVTASTDIVQISGMSAATAISISGAGTPQYRICSTSDCSAVDQTWGSTAGSIANGKYLQLRLTSSGSSCTGLTATVTVGGVSDSWAVTTTCPSCPTNGLRVHYKFDETSGSSTAADSSGNLVTGTLSYANTATIWVAGKNGNALAFDGVNDNLDAGYNAALNITTGQYSTAFWLNFSGAINSVRHVFNRGNPSPAAYQLWFYTGKLQFVYCSGANANCNPPTYSLQRDAIANNAMLNSGTWDHYAMTYNDAANTVAMYKNGTAVTVNGNTAATNSMQSETTRGLNMSFDSGFVVKIDDFRIYNTALTAPEVSQLYNSGSGCP